MTARMKKLSATSFITALVLMIFFVPCVHAQVTGPQQSTTGPKPSKEVIERDAQKPIEVAAVEETLPVPGYNWRHGCGPTAVGMVVGYFDGLAGFDLIPGDASTQTAAVDQVIASGGDSSNPNPPGSEQHYEDYAVPEDAAPGPLLDDDYITAMRIPHADDCIADYMHTSKSTYSNYYGWSWSNHIGPAFVSYVNQQNPAYSPTYTDYYMGSSLTWSVLTNEIDNGYPMVFLVDTGGDGVTDHFVTVIGYRITDSSVQQYGCLDTWNGSTVRWENFQQIASDVLWGIYCGCSFSASAINSPPVAVCQNVIVPADDTGHGIVYPEDIDDGSYDPDGDPITLTLDPPGPYPLGDTSVTLIVSDGIESDTCSATVTVVPAGINITMTVNQSNPCFGDTVIYTICIENTGILTLENVIISDPQLGGVLPVFPPVLEPGEVFCGDFTYIVPEDAPCPLLNCAGVTSNAIGFPNIIEDDDCAEICPEPCGGEEGCGLGFWKNHSEYWVCYEPDTSVECPFIFPEELKHCGIVDLNSDGEPDTLMDALKYKGGKGIEGGARNLLQQATPALLNACDPSIAYPLSVIDVQEMTRISMETLNRVEMLDLKDLFDMLNNLGCPF